VSTLVITLTQAQALRNKLSKQGYTVPDHYSLDELKQLATSKALDFFSATFDPTDPHIVAKAELERLGHTGTEYGVYLKWLDQLEDTFYGIDGQQTTDQPLIEQILINESFCILHGVSSKPRTQSQQVAFQQFATAPTSRTVYQPQIYGQSSSNSTEEQEIEDSDLIGWPFDKAEEEIVSQCS
jgi:hypothetical protein